MKKTLSIILSLVLAMMAVIGTFAPVSFADEAEETADTAAVSEAVEPTEDTEPAEDDTAEAQDTTTIDLDNIDYSTLTEEEKLEIAKEEADAAAKENAAKKKTMEAKASSYAFNEYLTAEEKLADMDLMYSAYGYELYCDTFSGEVAVKDTKTGRMLFTNPYDVATVETKESVKQQILSQIKLTYQASDGEEKEMYSFNEAVAKGQVKVKNLKNGIRVEFALGDEETRYLVPRLIRKDRYEDLIFNIIKETGDTTMINKFDAYYILEDPSDPELTAKEVQDMYRKFPITEKMPVYVFDAKASARELRIIQQYIKEYCPKYTYAVLQEDHDITGYTVTDKDPPLFRMAIEYTLDEDGLSYRLPANGIRYNSDEYQLLTLQVLPYFGAGSGDFTGYTMIPDGSGALFRFEDFRTTSETKTGKIYGIDYAYHNIGTIKQETMRLPVFGIVENYVGNSAVVTSQWFDAELDPETGAYTPEGYRNVAEYTPLTQSRGYCGIIEEGDALVSLTTYHGGTVHKYNTVYAEFNPRPIDEYNLADSISVADNKPINVSSKRKFTGSYRVRAIMLNDDATAEKAGLAKGEYCETSYVGMAKAYREYLEKKGVLTKKTDSTKDIPLYIESFGAIEIASSFLSFPTTKMVALTTFDNIKTMYDDLAKEGISNVNFRLTGFANGGIDYTVPNGVEFEDAVGGNDGYKDLVEYAKEKDFGVFPDFNFTYKYQDGNGYKASKDAIKTIDGRYTSKRVYRSTYQLVMPTTGIAISPSVFDRYYDNLKKDIDKLGVIGISAGTLGSDLNSDFDEKDPYNRVDCMEIVSQLLERMQNDYGNVMVDGGNAYSFKSADHILNITLDSSHFNNSAYSIPFTGLVLHGYKNFAGAPTNMSSDIGYETLKMIENGALPYFTLSYSNTPLLKDSTTYANYYSVSYDIWFDDLVSVYNKLNGLLKDLQDETIDGHEFIVGERVPSEAEIEADAQEAAAIAEAEAAQAALLADKLHRAEILAARKGGYALPEDDTAEDANDEAASAETESAETAPAEEAPAATQTEKTKYTVDDGSIVKITYSNGTTFILNYNRFTVTAEGQTIEPLGYVRIN